MNEIPLSAKLGAEALGTFWLVFGGCGAAVLAAQFLSGDADPIQLGIGFLGVSLAFGLTVLTGAFAFGHVSGGHFNPAVSIGLAIAKRFDRSCSLPYIVTQLVAATAAGAVLLVIANGKPGFNAVESGFATNGYGDRSPGGYSLLACFMIEVVLTAVFLYIILGATDDRAPRVAPIAIGLGLTLIHLVSIPVTNTSVNPARSLGVAWFVAVPPWPRSGCSSWHRSSVPRSPVRRTRRSPARRSPARRGCRQQPQHRHREARRTTVRTVPGIRAAAERPRREHRSRGGTRARHVAGDRAVPLDRVVIMTDRLAPATPPRLHPDRRRRSPDLAGRLAGGKVIVYFYPAAIPAAPPRQSTSRCGRGPDSAPRGRSHLTARGRASVCQRAPSPSRCIERRPPCRCHPGPRRSRRWTGSPPRPTCRTTTSRRRPRCRFDRGLPVDIGQQWECDGLLVPEPDEFFLSVRRHPDHM